MINALSRTALLAFVLAVAGLPAAAQDATAIADLMVALAARSGGNDTRYESAETDGGSIVIINFQTHLKEDDVDMQIASIRIADPVPRNDGGLDASAVVASGITLAAPDSNITIEEIVTTQASFPAPSLSDKEFQAASKSAYASVEARDILVQTEQKGDMPIARVAFTNGDIVDGVAHRVSFLVEGIVVDPQLADDAEARESAEELGYDKVTLGAALAARWDEPASTLHIETFELGGEDVSYLKLSASIGGITRELATSTSQEEASRHLHGVNLNAASIRFENDSLVERVIAKMAAEEGTTPRDFVNTTLVQIPDMMALLGSPDLAAQATEALSTFLKEPKNISVATRLEAGVPVMQIFGMALMAPAAAVELLKLEFQANE